MVLIAVTVMVMAPLAVFAVRLWRAEREEPDRRASCPVPASADASMLDAVLIDVHWHMLAVFLTLAGDLRHRAGPLPRGPEPRTARSRARVCCGRRWRSPPSSSATSPCWRPRALPPGTRRMTPPGPEAEPPLEIHVAAEQFAWNIHYPGPDGRFGRTDAMLIAPVESDRHRSRRPGRGRRHRPAEHPDAADRPPDRGAGHQPRRRAQLHAAGDAGEAGRDAGDDRTAHGSPRRAGIVGDYVLAAVRARSLPDARRVSGGVAPRTGLGGRQPRSPGRDEPGAGGRCRQGQGRESGVGVGSRLAELCGSEDKDPAAFQRCVARGFACRRRRSRRTPGSMSGR